jgi:hypothetical protein
LFAAQLGGHDVSNQRNVNVRQVKEKGWRAYEAEDVSAVSCSPTFSTEQSFSAALEDEKERSEKR